MSKQVVHACAALGLCSAGGEQHTVRALRTGRQAWPVRTVVHAVHAPQCTRSVSPHLAHAMLHHRPWTLGNR